jgi:tetratricopeptide (TPR) repeat protein
MRKHLSALILVGMLASESSSVMAQAPLIMPGIAPENSTMPSDRKRVLHNLIENANNKIKKGEYQAARLDLNKAIEISPQNAPLFALRGIVYAGLERHEKAIQDYNQAIQIDPQNITFYNLRGESYGKIQRYELAVINYSQVLQINPKSSQAYIKRAEAYRALKDGDKSIADFNQAIAVNPQDPEVYNSRGKFYADIFSGSRSQTKISLPLFSNSIQDAQHKAFKDYDMAIKLNPKVAIYYYNRGSLHVEIWKIYGGGVFGLFGGDSEKKWAINDLKIAAKIFLEAGDENNYKFVMQTIDTLN